MPFFIIKIRSLKKKIVKKQPVAKKKLVLSKKLNGATIKSKLTKKSFFSGYFSQFKYKTKKKSLRCKLYFVRRNLFLNKNFKKNLKRIFAY